MQLTVGELAHGGAAVARVDGRVVFVEGALPGETVEAEVTHRRKDFWRAEAVRVLDAAEHRIVPPCQYFRGGCGGCQLQHLDYPGQLEEKRRILHRQLHRLHLDFPLEDIDLVRMAYPWRYRLRGEFHVFRSAGEVKLGFYRKHTYRTIPIDSCPIHVLAIERALPGFAEALTDKRTERVQALQLTWAPGTNDMLWSAYPPGTADSELGSRAAAHLPDFNLNDDSIGIEDEGRHFRVRPETFVQVNAWLRGDLFAKALQFLGPQPDERIVDAYAGIGMLSARIAARTGEVVCIEESPYAVRLGELNAQLNDFHNVSYLRGRVEDVLGSLEGRLDGLVLDPPRAGCAESALKAIVEAEPNRIVYLSCEPSTLARDLARFSGSGRYTLSDVALVDMFPQTYHFETVVKLERRSSG